MNTLYYGDNLDMLRRYIKDETADMLPLRQVQATYKRAPKSGKAGEKQAEPTFWDLRCVTL